MASTSIFLSHNSGDKLFVRQLARRLTEAGVLVWLDEAELSIGDSLIEKIGAAIEEMEYVAAIISPRSVRSRWVQKELSLAMSKEIRGKKVVVLPMLIEPCDLPDFLQDKLYADFTDPARFEEELAKVLRAVGIRARARTSVKSRGDASAPAPRTSQDDDGFVDIAIIGVDRARTHNPDPTRNLYDVYLQLSTNPPEEWEAFFRESRHFPRHTGWRKAWIEGPYIVVHCALEELKERHLPYLKEDVETANSKYRDLFRAHRLREKQLRERQEEENRKRDDLLDSLDF